MRGIAYVLALVTLSAGFAARASAEDVSMVVLGLRSAEGDDDLANSMTDALRQNARKVSGWKVVDRAVSMAQMSLAHGCDDIDAACLSEIAKGLQAERLLFGTVRRIGPKNKYDFEVSVSLFNATSRAIGATQTANIPRAEAHAKKSLLTIAEPLVAKLSAADSGGTGTLSLQVNVASVEVKLDGQVVGQTRDQQLVLEGLKDGEHHLELTAIGHLTHNQQVLIASGQRTEIKINLEPVPEPEPEPAPALATAAQQQGEESSGSIAWLGYTLISVGAVSLVGWGVSMYMVDQTNKDETFVTYKRAFPVSTDDVCDLADSGNTSGGRVSAAQLAEVQSLCNRGRTANMLQWVFLGAGVLTASIGTFILVSESADSGDEHASAQAKRRPVLTLRPELDRRSFGFQSQLRF